MAALLQLHFDLHPVRIARRYGVSAGYVRQQWREYGSGERGDLRDALRIMGIEVKNAPDVR